MAETSTPKAVNNPPLGNPKRVVTTHDASGKAVFSTAFPETLPMYEIPGMLWADAYKTYSAPDRMTDEADITALQKVQTDGGEGAICFPEPGGTILRYCDWPPLGSSPLHRHESMDYGIVLHGAMEAIMDSGETRLLKAGDCIVQRGTLHEWRNPSATEAARMIFIIRGCPPVEVAGKEMKMDLDAFGK